MKLVLMEICNVFSSATDVIIETLGRFFLDTWIQHQKAGQQTVEISISFKVANVAYKGTLSGPPQTMKCDRKKVLAKSRKWEVANWKQQFPTRQFNASISIVYFETSKISSEGEGR